MTCESIFDASNALSQPLVALAAPNDPVTAGLPSIYLTSMYLMANIIKSRETPIAPNEATDELKAELHFWANGVDKEVRLRLIPVQNEASTASVCDVAIGTQRTTRPRPVLSPIGPTTDKGPALWLIG